MADSSRSATTPARFPHVRPGNIEESVCLARRYRSRTLGPRSGSGAGPGSRYRSYSDPHLSLPTDLKQEVTREKQVDKLNNAIFLVTEEHSCPIYNVGEELKVENFCLSVPAFKPQCLYLSQSIMNVITTRATFSGLSRRTGPKTRFDCGGCQGLIYFEFKKEKDFATLQMKLLMNPSFGGESSIWTDFFPYYGILMSSKPSMMTP